MNEVLQTVMDYVSTPKTDYAILINGPWGCGKTFFWKHIVTPELEKLDGPREDELRVLREEIDPDRVVIGRV